MSNKDQPAFPLDLLGEKSNLCHGGLTKREYFAAAALQGLLANGSLPMRANENRVAVAGEHAIAYADWILQELERDDYEPAS